MTSTVNQMIPVEPFGNTFTDRNRITGCAIYQPQTEDKLNSANYFVKLGQSKTHGAEQVTILYPLDCLDELDLHMDMIICGTLNELFTKRKFEGIGRKLLIENQDNEYFIEYKADGNPIKIIQKNIIETKVIEVKNVHVHTFNIMLDNIAQNVEKHLQYLENELEETNPEGNSGDAKPLNVKETGDDAKSKEVQEP